jgi:hypothetical protein
MENRCKAKGIKLSDKFVHTIRYNAKKSAAKKAGKSSLAAPASAVLVVHVARPARAVTASRPRSSVSSRRR